MYFYVKATLHMITYFLLFQVTGIIVPVVIANTVSRCNVLDVTLCDITGFIVTLSCVCSIANLTVIAANRLVSIINIPRTRTHTQAHKHTGTQAHRHIKVSKGYPAKQRYEMAWV